MNYKDFSQFALKEAIVSTLDDFENENDQFDPKEWDSLLDKLLMNRKSDKFDDADLKKLVEYFVSYSCTEAIKGLIESEIPHFILSYIVFYVQNQDMNKNDRQFSIKDIKKISRNKQLERCLFLINELFKAHELFNYELITNEILYSLFIIYEFSDSTSSDFSISILTRFAEHSLECLNYINSTFYFKKRIMEKLKRIQKLSSIYALFPFLNDESTYHNGDSKEISIIEFLLKIQQDHKINYEISIPILQFYNIYMNHSDDSLEKAVNYQGIGMIKSGLETETYGDEKGISILKQTAVDMLIHILESPFEEYKFIILNDYNILKIIRILLSRKSEYDNLAACQLLYYLLLKDFIVFTDDTIIEEIIQIISLLHELFDYTKYNVKSQIIKIYSLLLQSGNDLIISNIGKDGVFDTMIDSVEMFDDETIALVMKSLFFAMKNYDQCLYFFDQEDAINVFTNLQETSENLDVLCISRSVTEFLTQQ